MPSSSLQQHHFFQAIYHNPEFAEKVGVKKSVAEKFLKADEQAKLYSKDESNIATYDAFLYAFDYLLDKADYLMVKLNTDTASDTIYEDLSGIFSGLLSLAGHVAKSALKSFHPSAMSASGREGMFHGGSIFGEFGNKKQKMYNKNKEGLKKYYSNLKDHVKNVGKDINWEKKSTQTASGVNNNYPKSSSRQQTSLQPPKSYSAPIKSIQSSLQPQKLLTYQQKNPSGDYKTPSDIKTGYHNYNGPVTKYNTNAGGMKVKPGIQMHVINGLNSKANALIIHQKGLGKMHILDPQHHQHLANNITPVPPTGKI